MTGKKRFFPSPITNLQVSSHVRKFDFLGAEETFFMQQILDGFWRDVPRQLENLRAHLDELSQVEDAAAKRRIVRRIFQRMHTLKGTTAAFEISAVSELAHELENLLDRMQFDNVNAAQTNRLNDGINRLEQALSDAQNNRAQQSFAGFLSAAGARRNPIFARSNQTESRLPPDLLAKLSNDEKTRLAQSSDERNAQIAVVNVEFELPQFAKKTGELRFALEEIGEIIATLPGANAGANKIGLQIIVAHCAKQIQLNDCARHFAGHAAFFNDEIETNDFERVCATPILAGRQIALNLGKEVEITTGGELRLTAAQQDALAVALLHLVRNAVAHGIETPLQRTQFGKSARGQIHLVATTTDAEIVVRVIDDGHGIDWPQIRAKARAKNLIEPDGNEVDLLFESNVSTAREITQVAGRGVGLQAVADAVRSTGGQITVDSELGRGTTFEIILPND